MHLVQRFSIALIPLQKNCCSWSFSQPFAVQITSSSSENLCPFMNSFSLRNKRKNHLEPCRTTHLLTRQLKHWLPSKMPALNYSVTRRWYSYRTAKWLIERPRTTILLQRNQSFGETLDQVAWDYGEKLHLCRANLVVNCIRLRNFRTPLVHAVPCNSPVVGLPGRQGDNDCWI